MTKSNEVELVFTPYITLKNGHRIYARQYGKKVFCFPKKRTESTKKKSVSPIIQRMSGDHILSFEREVSS